MGPMTPVFFYHLERQPLDAVLPKLLGMSLERGWRVVVQAGTEERAEALSTQLWCFDDDSFLPHGTKADGFPDLQPVWLTGEDDNPNNANIRFYVDGAAVGEMVVRGSTLRDLDLDDYRSAETLHQARGLMRALIGQRLHGQPLHTRSVLLELQDL